MTDQSLGIIPSLLITAFISALLLAFLGWVIAVVGGFKLEKGQHRFLKFCLVFPPTTLIAVLFLLNKKTLAAVASLSCFVLSCLAVPYGANLARHAEINALERYEDSLTEQGETLDSATYTKATVPPEANVWEHPAMKTIAGVEGDESDDLELSISKLWERAAQSQSDDMPGVDSEAPDTSDFLRRLLFFSATDELGNQDEDSDRTIDSWQQIAQLALAQFADADNLTQQLEEALCREHDQFPLDWDDDPMNSRLLRQLVVLKLLSRSTVARASAHAAGGDSAEWFRMSRLGFRLSETGDVGLLISRLARFGRLVPNLDGIRFAQNFHVGDAAQWSELSKTLDRLNFPALMPETFRAERAYAYHLTSKQSISKFLQFLANAPTEEDIGLPPPESETTPEKTGLLATAYRWLLRDLIESVLLRQRRIYLSTYDSLVANTEKALALMRQNPETPWTKLDQAYERKPGFRFSRVYTDPLILVGESTFDKALKTQHHLELAKVAVFLERYYLNHQTYPERLADLTSEFPEITLDDPMTGEPWDYRKSPEGGFQIRSTGPKLNETEDDLNWSVSASVTEIPSFD